MSRIHNHPEDFSPCLDGDVHDPRYAELNLHVNSCSTCADEIKEWRAVEASFRSPEFEIEVPAFQWQRIRARLETQAVRVRWWERLAAVWSPRRLAWNAAFGAMLVLVLTFSGLEYRKYADGQQLIAIATFSRTEQAELNTAENPFSSLESRTASENPFAKFQNSEPENPFAIR